MAFVTQKQANAAELLTRLRKFRGRLPADYQFDRLEAHERGQRLRQSQILPCHPGLTR